MIDFHNEPLFCRAPRGRFMLHTPLWVTVDGIRYTIPGGFFSDGSSVPPWAWALVGHPYSPSSLRAALLHDWMCRNPQAHGLSAQAVHRIFYRAMRMEGVASARALSKYIAVAIAIPTWSTIQKRVTRS